MGCKQQEKVGKEFIGRSFSSVLKAAVSLAGIAQNPKILCLYEPWRQTTHEEKMGCVCVYTQDWAIQIHPLKGNFKINKIINF